MAGFLKSVPKFLAASTAACAAVLALAPPAMAGDAAAGARVFQGQCGLCHVAAAGASPTVGPNLYGVVGRKAGSQPAYMSRYSPAMRTFGKVWTASLLEEYLANPAKLVPGNRMPYAGLHNPAQAADVAAWLGAQH